MGYEGGGGLFIYEAMDRWRFGSCLRLSLAAVVLSGREPELIISVIGIYKCGSGIHYYVRCSSWESLVCLLP